MKKIEKKILFNNFGINNIYWNLKNQNYYDINSYCNNYKLLDVNLLSKYFDYFHIENVEFNPSYFNVVLF